MGAPKIKKIADRYLFYFLIAYQIIIWRYF